MNALHEKLERISTQTKKNVQRGHVEATGTEIVIPLLPVDISSASVSVSGPIKVYTLSEKALHIDLTEPGFVNWEVQG